MAERQIKPFSCSFGNLVSERRIAGPPDGPNFGRLGCICRESNDPDREAYPSFLSRKCNREPRRSFTRESPAPLGAAGVSPGAFRGALCALKDKPWVSGRQANSVLPQAGAKPNGGATNKTIFMLVWEPWFGTTLWLVLALLSAAERRPALQHARVALFPLHQLRRHLEPVLNLNVKKELGLIVKPDGNVVVLVRAVELNRFHHAASQLRELNLVLRDAAGARPLLLALVFPLTHPHPFRYLLASMAILARSYSPPKVACSLTQTAETNASIAFVQS